MTRPGDEQNGAAAEPRVTLQPCTGRDGLLRQNTNGVKHESCDNIAGFTGRSMRGKL
jgi:hypothetical protein